MPSNTRSHFGFIGFGLIGGSIALALRALYPKCTLTAYNYYETKPHKRLELAKEQGMITEVTGNLSDFASCDVIFLCAPVVTNVSYLARLKPYLNDDCILTDVGSVKGNIHQAVHDLGLDRRFVGGHPMTGAEKTGYEYASAELLKGAYYLLTPTSETIPAYTEWLEQFAKAAGSVCMILDADTHDRITAAISHGPHVISAVLVSTVAANSDADCCRQLAAGGFRDITRISSSSPEMWENICVTNKDSILSFLDAYTDQLEKAKRLIQTQDSEGLIKLFTDAKTYRDTLGTGNNP